MLASILPMSALGLIGLSYLFGLDNFVNILLTITFSLIFAASVIWWWWTAHTVLKVSKIILETGSYLKHLKDDINKLRDQIDHDRK